MNKLFLRLFGVAILFASCKEDHNLVDMTTHIQSTDTTYVLPASAIPAPNPHNVLIEDFTGVSCSNCPEAHDQYLVPLDSANPGRVIIMEMFVTDFPQTTPYTVDRYGGFRDTPATIIENRIYASLVKMPIAGIDRIPDPNGFGFNNIQESDFDWANTVTGTGGRLYVTDSLNLLVSSSFNTATDTATIVVTITYLNATTDTQNLSIAILEDSLVDYQDFTSGNLALYNYNGVFRDLVTPVPFGDTILTHIPAKEAGRVVIKTYKYYFDKYKFNENKLLPPWNYKNCRVVAFVNGSNAAAGQPIYQSWQTPLAH